MMTPTMTPLDELIGESPGIVAVRERIGRLLSRPSATRRLPPVLIQGETGTGKGLIARGVHRMGPRATGPFVDVNCAAIPETLLEAEVFGFERGAFTDARQAKRGLFQAAHGGTLFLDEVGLLPEGLQAKLLKVIEERVVRRLGSTQGEPVDVWIIAASNTDLQAATRERRFREDLYHRLAVLTLWLPPLRERGGDILLLAEHFLGRACVDYALAPKTLDPETRAALLAHAWPGNIRELANVMERVALLSEAPLVMREMLALPEASARATTAATRPDEVIPLAAAVEGVERAHLLEALRETGWNISRASVRLGISRNTLRYRIEKHGLHPKAASPPTRRQTERRSTSPMPTPGPLVLPLPVESPMPAAVRWERRRLTVLWAIVMLPAGEDARLDSSRALEVVVDKVLSFGGRVEALSPTGVVAVFGLEPAEDAPRRAANAAMAIQRAAERAREGDVGEFRTKIGIHVGQFMVGRVGDTARIDEDGKRETWPVVEALVTGAESGAILVSEAAAPFLTRRFDLQSAAPPEGRPGPVYRLARAERGEFEAGRRITRFVGRQGELEMLWSLLTSAVAGQGQVVGIVGEPGIGKSRLLFEFRQSLAGQAVTYLEGHCFEYGKSMPYLPVLEVLRQNCGIVESDSPAAIAEKVRRGLEEVEADPKEEAPYLLHLLGVKEGTRPLDALSPEAIKARTFKTLRHMTFKGSHRRPIVFGIEDLHWVDSISEELIASLVESLADEPILFVATYRPGYRPAWMEKSFANQVAIGPLSSRDSLTLIQSVLQVERVSEPLARVILEKAQGNPFFLEELARTVGQRGDLRLPVRVPDTVQEALLARIDRLPDGPKRLLQIASVLGREFSLRLLNGVWKGPGRLEPHLHEVRRLEFLHEQTGGEEPVYVFRHALTQEVTYESILESQRRFDHATAGAALETLYAGRTDEAVELLAHHFGRSGEAEKAVDYAILAGEKAQRRWANTEALAHFEGALKRLDAMPDTPPNRLRRIDAVVKQAEIKFALGRHAEHIHALEGIRDVVGGVSDARRRAAWYYWTGFLHSLTGAKPEVAIAYCREALAIAEAGGYDEIRPFADCCLAHVYVLAGEFRAAVAAGERALATFEARGNVWWACRTLWALAPAANALGEWGPALEYCRRALEHGRAVNDLRLKVVGWWRTGSTHILRGDPEAGLRCCEEALTLSPIPFDAAMARAMKGYGLVKAGALAGGTSELADAVAWFERSGLRYTHSSFSLRLGEGYLRQGERLKARAVLEEALATSRELGYRYLEGMASRLLAEVLAREDPTAAAAHLDASVQILEEMGARDELAKAWVVQADLRRGGGDPAGARQLLERALVAFETLGTLDEPPRVRATLATLAGAASA